MLSGLGGAVDRLEYSKGRGRSRQGMKTLQWRLFWHRQVEKLRVSRGGINQRREFESNKDIFSVPTEAPLNDHDTTFGVVARCCRQDLLESVLEDFRTLVSVAGF